MNTPDIEIDMSGGPTVAKFQTPVSLGLAAIREAQSISDLEKVVAALRSLTEPEKVVLRPQIKARAAVLKQVAELAVPAPTPVPEFVPTLVASPTPSSEPTATFNLSAGSFTAIADESAANANTVASGSLAEGTMQGVGFSTAEGYLTALRRGTTAATRTEYVRILRERFHIGRNEAEFPLIAQSDAPVGAGITHTPTGPSVFDLPKAQRTRSPIPVIPAEPVRRVELKAGNLVAGANDAADGVFLSWSGLGELKISAIEDALTAARAPLSWAPARKSRHFHAAEALKPMSVNGLVVRAERGGAKTLRSLTTGTQRRYSASWSVLLPAHSAVGTEAGKTIARFQLAASGELESTCEPGYEKHCTGVTEDFERRAANEILPAGDVTKWLRGLLVHELGAVRVGGNFYVRADHKDIAERICFALAQGWGVDWMLPALPVATSKQLQAGLVRGFVAEVQELLHEVDKASEQARKEKKLTITPGAAASFLAKLRETNERAKTYAEVLGPDSVASVSRAVKSAIAVLEPLCDSTAERFAALEPYAMDGVS